MKRARLRLWAAGVLLYETFRYPRLTSRIHIDFASNRVWVERS